MSYELTESVYSKISNHYKEKLDALVLRKKIPMMTLIAIAIEHEFEKEKPFDYDLSAPVEEYIENAYASEGGKILNYLGKTTGMSKESLFLMRHDIGIPDKDLFHLAFRDCILAERIESYIPRKGMNAKFKPDDDCPFYRLKGSNTVTKREQRKKASEYERFQRLSKKFGNK